ncbi:hypothetical protein ACFQ12_10775, partial [Methylobacterium trifolii]
MIVPVTDHRRADQCCARAFFGFVPPLPHEASPLNAFRLCTILLLGAGILAGPASAAPRPPDGDLTFACNFLGDCPRKTAPGGPDRDVRPFEGSLGRPC